MAEYGRNRESIVDMEETIYRIIQEHPESTINANDEPVVPIKYGLDILDGLSRLFGEILSPSEMDQFRALIESNPDLEMSPGVLVPIIAMFTKNNEQESSPQSSPNEDTSDLPGRGRTEYISSGHSRSSSNESSGTLYHSSSRPPSRATSRGPPQTPKGPSPFDSKNRQLKTPLPPSSWNKPAPASRRRSMDGSRSDSEQSSGSISLVGRTPGRRRAPSIPTSPTGAQSPDWDDSFSDTAFSPPSTHSSFRRGHTPQSPDNSGDYDDDSFMAEINSLPMPTADGPRGDSDDEADDIANGLILELPDRRSIVSSNASLMDPHVRIDALQKHSDDLKRQMRDQQEKHNKTVQEYESEIYELNGRVEELRQELNSAKKDEKELRTKERSYMNQINALESDISKLTKSLELARVNYGNLQKQFQEQCTFSEKYREDLRQRDETIRSLRDTIGLGDVENAKRLKEAQQYDERIQQLERELEIAQQNQAELEEQKQENLMLKETIDRLKFEMDDMRNNLTAAVAISNGGASGRNSTHSTMTRSLGAEFSRVQWTPEEEAAEEAAELPEAPLSPREEISFDEDDIEGEDVVQTIITRKKRKIASRATARIEQFTFEETKEYSDAGCQYEPWEFFRSAGSQTVPPPKVISASIQTTPPPPVQAITIQTEEELPIPRVEMEIQTDPIEVPRPPTPVPEPPASTSVPVPPVTPNGKRDVPPTYDEAEEDKLLQAKIASEAMSIMRKLHPGLTEPIEPVPGGISKDAEVEWDALKKELKLKCNHIDEVMAISRKTGLPRDANSRKNRFYSIYNTYVYRGKDGPGPWGVPYLSTTLVAAGASAVTALIVSHLVQSSSIPGGPTPFDRPAWNSFNSMPSAGEGFSPDGTAMVFDFLGRVTGGAARIARGWPT